MSEDSYHYALMRRALDVIDAADTPIDLAALAAEMGLSPAHFQRLFSRFVGVSPARYQQYLRLDHAKALLRDHCTTLQVAQDVGLSGSGRLHDLFLTWEGMTPGQYAKDGAGLTIHWAAVPSPFGPAVVMATDRGICAIGFAGDDGDAACLQDLQSRWPAATYIKDAGRIAPLAQQVFAMKGRASLHILGAPFQIKVWEALLQIPAGQVTTYSHIANAIGTPKAVRAVGTAVGRNPISWLIPCHRALRKSGGLGGYHWGLPVKRCMLAFETALSHGDA